MTYIRVTGAARVSSKTGNAGYRPAAGRAERLSAASSRGASCDRLLHRVPTSGVATYTVEMNSANPTARIPRRRKLTPHIDAYTAGFWDSFCGRLLVPAPARTIPFKCHDICMDGARVSPKGLAGSGSAVLTTRKGSGARGPGLVPAACSPGRLPTGRQHSEGSPAVLVAAHRASRSLPGMGTAGSRYG